MNSAKKPLVITGATVEQHRSRAEILSSLAALIAEYKASFLPITGGSNSLGAWLAGAVPHRAPGGVIVDAKEKETSVFQKQGEFYFLLGFDPALDCATNHELMRSLKSADFVVALTAFDTESLRDGADLMLPIALFPENEGTLVNGFGRHQYYESAVRPPADVRSAWKILRKLGGDIGLDGFDAVLCGDITRELPECLPLAELSEIEKKSAAAPVLEKNTKGLLEVLVEVAPYSVDQLVRHADSLQKMPLSGGDCIRISEYSASGLHLSDGDRVGLESKSSRAIGRIQIDNRVPRHTCVLAGGRPSLMDVARNGSSVRIFSMQGDSLA